MVTLIIVLSSLPLFLNFFQSFHYSFWFDFRNLSWLFLFTCLWIISVISFACFLFLKMNNVILLFLKGLFVIYIILIFSSWHIIHFFTWSTFKFILLIFFFFLTAILNVLILWFIILMKNNNRVHMRLQLQLADSVDSILIIKLRQMTLSFDFF
jgi:hypothetical protein